MMSTPLNPETRMAPSFWLRLARWAVIAYAVFSFAAFVTGTALFPAYAARHLSDFTANNFWTHEQTLTGLAQLGWPPMTLFWINLAQGLFFTFVIGAVGFLILWRKSDDWFGLYLAFILLNIGGISTREQLVEVLPGFRILSDLLGAAGWQFFFITFYFFPDGRLVPRWTRWLVLTWASLIILGWIFPGFIRTTFGTWVYFGFIFSALGSQIFRYFWRSDPIQRQQTKWVLLVVVILIATITLIAPRAFATPTGPDFGTALFTSLVNLFIFQGAFLLFPVAIVIAILRYRLWDIDLLIRRTLQYSLLSGLLAFVYFGGIVVLQGIFTTITGTESPIALVASTLAIAALFLPLRRRVQDFIDKRFYRRKYDAAKVIADFAATARDETDLDALTTRLVEVVDETMQPESVGLWLKPTESLKHREDRGR